jgi:hypothetical protein
MGDLLLGAGVDAGVRGCAFFSPRRWREVFLRATQMTDG